MTMNNLSRKCLPIFLLILFLVTTVLSLEALFRFSKGKQIGEWSTQGDVVQPTDDDCPCSNLTWCSPLQIPLYSRKEVYGFSLNTDDWRHYDWSVTTTMAWFGAIEELPREWICWAHRHEARVVFTTSIPESILRQNTTSRESWARKLVEHVTAVGGDGLNLDYESPVTQTDVSRQEAMTHITHEIQVRLKASNPHSSLVWDFGWKPNVDVRFYPYRRMADICDHVFLMVYDTQSQVWDGPPCVAGPNAPKVNVEKTLRWYGVGDHDKTRNEDTTQVADSLNIPYEKIILGLPWYGYYYHCTEYDPVTERCTIPTVPFRGAPCSDAAGKQIDYPFTMDALKQGNAQGIFDPITLSMKAFVTNITTGNTTAYFYDSPETIRDKIRYAWEFTQGQLGGVGMWNVDVPDYTNKDQAKAFWQAMVVPPAPVSPGKIGDAVILGAIS